MNDVIRTEKLSKNYKDIPAVSDISLSVRKGEIYGFLGLNGAGKTTTIRMMLGMINPSEGNVYINDKKVYANNSALWQDIGYLVEIPYSYPELTVLENLEIVRRLRLLNDSDAVTNIMDKLKISQYKNRKAKQLSLGNAQRLGLAKALIHNPDILILDEPTNGLDPAGIYEIRELLHDLSHNQGKTIFISSHILGEVAKFSTRIGIIHNGTLIEELNTNELEKRCKKRLTVSTRDNISALQILNEKNIASIINENNILEINEEYIIKNPEQITYLLTNNQLPPIHLNVEEEDLESYFLRSIKMEGASI